MDKRGWIAACGLALYFNILSYPYFVIVYQACGNWGDYPRAFPDVLLLVACVISAIYALLAPASHSRYFEDRSRIVGIIAGAAMVVSGVALQMLPSSLGLPTLVHIVFMLVLTVGFVCLSWGWFAVLGDMDRGQLALIVLVGFVLSNVFCLVDQLPDQAIYVIYTVLPLACAPFMCAVRKPEADALSSADSSSTTMYGKIAILVIIIVVTVFVACSVIRGIWSRGGVGYWGRSIRTIESFGMSLIIGLILCFIYKASKASVWAELFSCVLFLAIIVLCDVSSTRLGVLAIGSVMSGINRSMLALCMIVFSSHLTGWRGRTLVAAGCYCSLFALSLVLSNSLVPFLFRYVGKADAQTMESIALLSLSCIVLGLCVFLVAFCVLLSREQADRAATSSETVASQDGVELLKERAGLTAREAEIASLIARGYTAKHIADDLFLSVNTVRSYTKTLYRKLDIHSKDELVEIIQKGN